MRFPSQPIYLQKGGQEMIFLTAPTTGFSFSGEELAEERRIFVAGIIPITVFPLSADIFTE